MPTTEELKEELEILLPQAMQASIILESGLKDGEKSKNILITLRNAFEHSKGKMSERLTTATQELASFLQCYPDYIYTQSMIAVSKSGNNEQQQLTSYQEKLTAIRRLQAWIDTVYRYHKLPVPTIKKDKEGVFGIYRTQEKVTKNQPDWRYKNLIDGMHRTTVSYPYGPNPVIDLNFEGLNIHDIQKICYDNGFDISINKIENGSHYFSIPIPNPQMFTQLKKLMRERSAEKILAQATENSPETIDGDALKIKSPASTSIGSP